MASFAKQLSLFLLLTLLSSLHARDSQFFNKVPSTTTNNIIPNNQETPKDQQEQDPSFIPDNENGYGLYGHESGQLPPSATTGEPSTTTPYSTESQQPTHKYLPKNYNPVAYVTVPEDINDRSQENNNNNYNNAEENYYNNNQQEQQETEFRNYPTSTNTRSYNFYSGGSSFNSQPQGLSDTRFRVDDAALNTHRNYFNNGFQPQGMSDTRSLENGKYFYNMNTEKYSSNHPYERLKATNEFNRNSENNAYEFNNANAEGAYQNQEEFQEENSLP